MTTFCVETRKTMNAYLLLANGMVFAGQSVGAQGVTVGEVVFSTGMVGFQETLTDPSYYGQIITQTYPLIGNYGMNHDDMESDRICLLANYELSQRKAVNGSLPEDGALVKTIVTTNLADAIAKGYNVNLIEVLTGFKYIGQQILGFENSGKGTYLFGFEESYGCLIGTYARDKDAIVATMALCEAAAYYKTQGKTLWDAMIDMYEEFGYYKDAIQAVTMKGIEGLQKIQEIMTTLRQNPPAEFAGHKVTAVRDYKLDEITDLATGEKKPTGLPNSNVLYYELTDDAWVCVRPSGTEPKVKFYYGVKGTSLADADEKSDAMGKAVLEMVDSMK